MIWREKWSFQKVLRVIFGILSGWKLWRERTGALPKFGGFL
jgi:hypothetical protein